MPRSLSAVGERVLLFTEAWCPPTSPWAPFRGVTDLGARYHSALAAVPVVSPTLEYLRRELWRSVRRLRGWDRIIDRNDWFGRVAVKALRAWEQSLIQSDSEVVLFSYSYTALAAFRYAKARGWMTVLSQIDAGPRYEEIVQEVAREFPWSGHSHSAAPPRYWDAWRQECELADKIVVNSNWTRECMIERGLPSSKLAVIPLVVDQPKGVRGSRTFPSGFSHGRPLRVLFAGQVTLGKGIGALLEAAAVLQGEPIEFCIVGPVRIDVPAIYRQMENIRWMGRVPHSGMGACYDAADVLLFPTHCDGYGLVQLEAQAHGLPIIASRFCGEVVTDGKNGLVLNRVSATEIATALRRILSRPSELEWFAKNSTPPDFDIKDLSFAMRALGNQ